MLFEEQVSDHSGLLLATMRVAAHGGDHLGLVGRPALAQGIGLHILIEQFVRAQFWAVAGQADQAKAMRVVRHEAFGGDRAMHWMTVHNQIELAFGLAQQTPHELDEQRILKLALKHHERKCHAIGDGGDSIVAVERVQSTLGVVAIPNVHRRK